MPSAVQTINNACSDGLKLYWWDLKELICSRGCVVQTDLIVFLRAIAAVFQKTQAKLNAAKSLRSLYNCFLLSYTGLCQLLFIGGIAEAAQFAKIADHHLLARLAADGWANWVTSVKDEECAAKVQVWVSLNCAEWQPLLLLYGVCTYGYM